MLDTNNKAAIRAFIFARGGSKGVPRKNVQLLGDRPLIAHAIGVALACPALGAVLVSTDDAEIAEVSKAYGAHVPFVRPSDLAADQSSEWLAWRHAIDWVERNDAPFDVFVSLPATAPFRVVADVEACISMLQDHPEFDIVVTVRAAERSPYFNMVKRGADGGATLAISDVGVVRRQDAPELFDMTTIAYAARTAFIKNKGGIFEGRVGMVEIPAERALDIDTPYDLKLARLLIADTGTASLQPEK